MNNVYPVDELLALARPKKNPSEFKSIPKKDLCNLLPKEGWQVVRKGKYTVRLARPKARSVLFEDRVWSLLYKLGFTRPEKGQRPVQPD